MAVTALAFSPDGKAIASISKDTKVLIWRLREKVSMRKQRHSQVGLLGDQSFMLSLDDILTKQYIHGRRRYRLRMPRHGALWRVIGHILD